MPKRSMSLQMRFIIKRSQYLKSWYKFLGITLVHFQFEQQQCTRKYLMNLTRFLFIIQKITISIIVLTFIPIALFVYKTTPINIPQSLQNAYETITHQLQLTGFLTSLRNLPVCQPPASSLFYQNCYTRCTIGSDCSIMAPGQTCFLAQKITAGNIQFCTTLPIWNQIDSNNSKFTLDATLTPLAHIQVSNTNQLVLQYYCILNISACTNVYNYFGKVLSFNYKDNYDKFWSTSAYLMYFGLIPLVAHILIVMILDLTHRFNLRLTNSLLIVHQALIGIGIIVNANLFNQKNDNMNDNLAKMSSSCIIQDSTYCQNTFIQSFNQFNTDDGVSSGFTVAMSFVLILQILCLIVIVIINILITRYYKLREIDPSSSGYQLQTL